MLVAIRPVFFSSPQILKFEQIINFKIFDKTKIMIFYPGEINEAWGEESDDEEEDGLQSSEIDKYGTS